MTVLLRHGNQWVADRTGLAHGTAKNGLALRALCGARPTAARYGWPVGRYCAVCLAIEKGQKGGATAKAS